MALICGLQGDEWMKTNLKPAMHGVPPQHFTPDKRHKSNMTLIKQLGRVPPDVSPVLAEGKQRDKEQQELTRSDVKTILEKTAELAKLFNSRRKIKYEVIEEADLVQIQVIDEDEGKIIRKIPSDEIVELVKKIHEVLSGWLDVKA